MRVSYLESKAKQREMKNGDTKEIKRKKRRIELMKPFDHFETPEDKENKEYIAKVMVTMRS